MESRFAAYSWMKWQPRTFFCISVLCHILALLIIFWLQRQAIIIIPSKEDHEKYYYYVPAYTPSAPAVSQVAPKANQNLVTEETGLMSTKTIADLIARQQPKTNPKELFKAAQIQTTYPEATVPPHDAEDRYIEPIRMVGDKLLDDPLRKLLGRAFTKRLYYPTVAQRLHLRGVVSIGFILHPNGEITDANVVKSSREKILDEAAFRAITSASPIANVDIYIKKAEYYVINIIF